jgi:hypothetical protein
MSNTHTTYSGSEPCPMWTEHVARMTRFRALIALGNATLAELVDALEGPLDVTASASTAVNVSSHPATLPNADVAVNDH